MHSLSIIWKLITGTRRIQSYRRLRIKTILLVGDDIMFFFSVQNSRNYKSPCSCQKKKSLLIIITTTTRSYVIFHPRAICARRWTCDRLSGYLLDLRFAFSIISYYNINIYIYDHSTHYTTHTHTSERALSSSRSHTTVVEQNFSKTNIVYIRAKLVVCSYIYIQIYIILTILGVYGWSVFRTGKDHQQRRVQRTNYALQHRASTSANCFRS